MEMGHVTFTQCLLFLCRAVFTMFLRTILTDILSLELKLLETEEPKQALRTVWERHKGANLHDTQIYTWKPPNFSHRTMTPSKKIQAQKPCWAAIQWSISIKTTTYIDHHVEKASWTASQDGGWRGHFAWPVCWPAFIIEVSEFIINRK